MATFPSRVRYEYTTDPQTRLQYAHGVWGGINSQGEIEIDFYIEGDKLPTYSERLRDSSGCYTPEETPDENVRTIVRHVHSKIVVNYQTARGLLEWLNEQLEAYDAVEADDNGTGRNFAREEPDVEQ